jgi:hypothetical protein
MRSSLSFLKNLPLYTVEKPYELWLPDGKDVPEGLPSTNCEFIEHSNIEFIDVRSINHSLKLDTAGFKFIEDKNRVDLSAEHLLPDQSPVLQQYFHDTIKLVKEETGAEKVICFDWRVRESTCHCQSSKITFKSIESLQVRVRSTMTANIQQTGPCR